MSAAPIRAPRSLTEAQRLCERWAEVDGQIAAIEEARAAVIAAANALADKDLAPLVAQRGAISDKLAPWWAENGAVLTQGKRKSAELGGVMLGTRTGKAKLAGSFDAVVEQLRKIRGGLGLVRVIHELDKPAALAALEGKQGERLRGMGLSRVAGAETFYVERTKQSGTLGKPS